MREGRPFITRGQSTDCRANRRLSADARQTAQAVAPLQGTFWGNPVQSL